MKAKLFSRDGRLLHTVEVPVGTNYQQGLGSVPDVLRFAGKLFVTPDHDRTVAQCAYYEAWIADVPEGASIAIDCS